MMLPVSSLFTLTLFLTQVPGALSGPACARRNRKSAECIQKCRSRWGWPGSQMGTDPWGSVMTSSGGTDYQSMLTQACGLSQNTQPAPAATQGVSATAFGAISDTTATAVSLDAQPTASSDSSTDATVNSQSSQGVQTTTDTQPAPTSSNSQTTDQSTSSSQVPPPPPPPPSPSPSSNNSGSQSGGGSGTSDSDIAAYLDGHNSLRAQHGAQPLTWNDTLASKGQQWANNCVFQHSGGSLGPFGENLAAGTGSSYGIPDAIKSWADEAKDYNSNNPVPSHFTQMVWKGTTQLGCAVQSCSGIFDPSFGQAKFFVCEYFPQGNIIGQFGPNVQA